MLPLGEAERYEPAPIGEGRRMVVFMERDYVPPRVLRVPFRTEHELGPPGQGAALSPTTTEEIQNYHALITHLGDSVVPVEPFTAPDSLGRARTYSRQDYIPQDADRRSDPAQPLGLVQIEYLRTFLNRMYSLIQNTGLIPDLAGRNNVVVDTGGRPRLIDVNNVGRLLGDEWISVDASTLTGRWSNVVNTLRTPGTKVHHAYFDDKGFPSADCSLWILRTLEARTGTRLAQLDADPIYGRLGSQTLRDFVLTQILNGET